VPKTAQSSDDVVVSDPVDDTWKRLAVYVSEGICPICEVALRPGAVNDIECGVCPVCRQGWQLHANTDPDHPLYKLGEMLVTKHTQIPERFDQR
jgi:hypothetical protein